MARLEDLPPATHEHLLGVPLPRFDATPFATGPPLAERRVALISTAGLQLRDDRPFAPSATDYRVLPGDARASDLVMSHVSANFDRTGFAQDWNIAFPLDRLRELAAAGTVGSVADFHYSLMGATAPERLESTARELAGLLRRDRVDGALLVPV